MIRDLMRTLNQVTVMAAVDFLEGLLLIVVAVSITPIAIMLDLVSSPGYGLVQIGIALCGVAKIVYSTLMMFIWKD